MVTLYIIKSLVKKFRYVGITDSLKRRLFQHNQGFNKSTRLYKPFQLIHTEKFQDYKKARTREKFLKSGMGRKFLDEIENA